MRIRAPFVGRNHPVGMIWKIAFSGCFDVQRISKFDFRSEMGRGRRIQGSSSDGRNRDNELNQFSSNSNFDIWKRKV